MKLRTIKLAAALGVALSTVVIAGTAGGATSATSPSKSHVTHHSPTYQYGINTYITYNCQTPAGFDRWAATEIAQFKALKANSIALAFPLYTDNVTANKVYAKSVCTGSAYQTPSATLLAGIVDLAHRAGLSVLLRPLLDQANLFKQGPAYWRGVLAPTNVSLWFSNYLTTLRPYLQMAQAHHVEHFCISTELNSLSHLSNWSTAIAIAHLVYHGDITFSYSWSATVSKQLHASTSPAIDTYPSLTSARLGDSPARLLSLWNSLLSTARYAVPSIAKTTIDEIGIPAQSGAYSSPYNFSLPLSKYPFNQTVQVNWFTAACAFMKSHHMKGIYYWGPFLSNNSGSMLRYPNPGRTSDIQPAAQLAIKKCFA